MNVDPGCFVKEDVLYLSQVEFYFEPQENHIMQRGLPSL